MTAERCWMGHGKKKLWESYRGREWHLMRNSMEENYWRGRKNREGIFAPEGDRQGDTRAVGRKFRRKPVCRWQAYGLHPHSAASHCTEGCHYDCHISIGLLGNVSPDIIFLAQSSFTFIKIIHIVTIWHHFTHPWLKILSMRIKWTVGGKFQNLRKSELIVENCV